MEINRGKLTFLAMALALPLFAAALPAAAQYGTDEKQQTFDYNPAGEEMPPAKKAPVSKVMVSVDYGDAELVNDPIRGVYMVSKSRWKSWVARVAQLLMVYLALATIILSLPKNEERNLIIAYALSGAGAVLSFWVFLCAWLLFQLNASAWMFVLPLSMVMMAATYIILMKIKRSDVSLTELKESFQKTKDLSNEDARLASIEGRPSDWPNQDFIK